MAQTYSDFTKECTITKTRLINRTTNTRQSRNFTVSNLKLCDNLIAYMRESQIIKIADDLDKEKERIRQDTDNITQKILYEKSEASVTRTTLTWFLISILIILICCMLLLTDVKNLFDRYSLFRPRVTFQKPIETNEELYQELPEITDEYFEENQRIDDLMLTNLFIQS